MPVAILRNEQDVEGEQMRERIIERMQDTEPERQAFYALLGQVGTLDERLAWDLENAVLDWRWATVQNVTGIR